MKWTGWLPVVSVILLGLGLFVFHWRSLEVDGASVRIGPGYVEGCVHGTCEAGEQFGMDVESSQEQFGSEVPPLMRFAFWSILVAAVAQLGLFAVGFGRARDHWLPRLLAVLASIAALSVTAVLVYSSMRATSSEDHIGPGVWITILGGALGAAVPMLRSNRAGAPS